MRIVVVGLELSAQIAAMRMIKAAAFIIDSTGFLDDAEAMTADVDYAAVLLSAHLPGAAPLAWLERQRRRSLVAPVAYVTNRDAVDERIAAFEAGADDCIRMPVTEREMVARLRAVMRRPPLVPQTALVAGNTRLDRASREVWVGPQRIQIPRREVSLLEQLMLRFNRVAPRTQLEANIYGYSDIVAPNSIEVGVSRIRRRLADADASVGVRTVRGVGYCLHAIAAPEQARRLRLGRCGVRRRTCPRPDIPA